MNKKIILLLVLVFVVSGCVTSEEEVECWASTLKQNINETIITIPCETCSDGFTSCEKNEAKDIECLVGKVEYRKGEIISWFPPERERITYEDKSECLIWGEKQDKIIEEAEEEIEIYSRCTLAMYEIEYIDEILESNCYALTNVKLSGYKLDILKESFDYIGKDVWAIAKEKIGYCKTIRTEGKVYCLRDNSTCLFIEDNKICDIIEVNWNG